MIDITNADHIASVLRDIQNRIPKTLLKHALSEVKLTPTISFVIDKAIDDPNFPEEKKEKLKQLKEAGEFSKKTLQNNPKIQKMIDNFVAREINKAIKEGRLPPRSKIGDIDFIRDMYKKMKQ